MDAADDGTASFKPSGKAVVRSKGFIVGKTKTKATRTNNGVSQWMISWDDFKGKKYHGNFNFNEVYPSKKLALIAKKKFYD